MINKLEFNNLVISNKKRIQRVKAQTNQKLIQKIKKLKYMLDKKPEHERNKERLGKATLSLEELKKLKCVHLVKQVLLLDKSPTAILTNGLSAPEEIAIAMVAVNKIMQDIVKSFRDKLGLTDENKAWQNELRQESKRRMKILRTEMKRKNRMEIKEQKIMARKRTEWLKTQNAEQNEQAIDDKDVEENDTDEENVDENDEGANVSTLGYWKIEPIEDIKTTKPSPKEKSKRKLLPKVNGDKENKKNEKKRTVKNNFESTKNVKPPIEKLEPAATDQEARAKFNNNSFNSIVSDFENDLQDKKKIVEIEKEEEITHVIDPFFITATGENYRSTAVVIRDGQVLEPQPNKTNDENRKSDKVTYKRPATDKYNKHIRPSNSAGNKGMPHKNIKPTETNNTIGLHPSWAAKQKLKPVIGSFQGKKIKFDDDDNFDKKEMELNKSVNSDNNYQTFSNKRNTKSGSNDNSNGLHPSWAAKQKLKASITDFKGKKITFDNEGDEAVVKNVVAAPTKQNTNKLSEADSDLHPSWIAKQKQKPAITAFQGKKITFADYD